MADTPKLPIPKFPLPGRLGDESMTLFTDPRADPRMLAAMSSFGMDQPQPAPPVNDKSSREAIHEFCAASEVGFGGLFSAYTGDVSSPPSGVERTETTIKGVDGNDIKLYIHRPANWAQASAAGRLPCIVHTHGGAMTILSTADPNYMTHRDALASLGMVAIGVEFRNASGKLGPHPFPAGLNDCVSATKWVVDNRDALGISKIVISGESGGGNLSIATAMKANKDGWVSDIDGVFSCCPYIHGDYANPTTQSLIECDTYFLECPNQMASFAKIYTAAGDDIKNPLAWPYWATVEELKGLPPMHISVNELDPLRDEGLVFYRRLLKAGVTATAHVVNGTCHAGDLIWIHHIPDVRKATLDAIHSFASSL
jgi:acetyl esterase/lipase